MHNDDLDREIEAGFARAQKMLRRQRLQHGAFALLGILVLVAFFLGVRWATFAPLPTHTPMVIMVTASFTSTMTSLPTLTFTPTKTPTIMPSATPTLKPLPATGLLAFYKLDGNSKDSLNNYPTITLINAPFNDNGAFCNGIYEHSADPNFCKIETPPISGLNYRKFSIGVDFKVSEYPSTEMPVIVGGHGWRWIGFNLKRGGAVSFLHNSANSNYSESVECQGKYYYPNTWHTALITYDGQTGLLYIDNQLACSVNFLIGTDGGEPDKSIMTTNYSNGAVFKGIIKNLRIYNIVFTP